MKGRKFSEISARKTAVASLSVVFHSTIQMHQNLRIFLCKSLCNHHFPRRPIPIFSFLPKIPKPPSNHSVSDPLPLSKPYMFGPPLPKSHRFLPSNLPTPVIRKFSSESNSDAEAFDKEIDEINLKFAEAREEIEMALESKETVYFDEEAELAREAAKTVLDRYENLLAKMPEDERAALQRSMGLKIEQLKAELEQLHD